MRKALFASFSYRDWWHRLEPRWGRGEAQAIVRLLAERLLGLSLADLLADGLQRLPADRQQLFTERILRVEAGEPVQYVLGEASFCGQWLKVSPSVLIPRPETEELCRWVVSLCGDRHDGACRLLDVGTGSGCIACTLAALMPGATVEAWDISEDALEVARENAKCTHVHVSFQRRDALHLLPPHDESWDVIVSNPPYICNNERAKMEPHVLDYEPSQALFVPDDQPLCFYEAIGRYARQTLTAGGRLFFEINPLYAAELCRWLEAVGFDDVVVADDLFGRQRFVCALQPR
ncbi:MAG: peptide chain release factor N(5)-glutamine methyltransferase [Prevotella sp.]|nr:peptide chain release factor N(5)-glutamine methyltransferase [Prevotella sp.]